MTSTARTHTVPGVGRFDTVSFTVRGRVTRRDYVHRRDVAGEADLVVRINVWRLIWALGDPEHERHAEPRTWAGEGYDPEAFDLAATNRALRKVRLPTSVRLSSASIQHYPSSSVG